MSQCQLSAAEAFDQRDMGYPTTHVQRLLFTATQLGFLASSSDAAGGISEYL